MGVIFDEVVTEIEPTANPGGGSPQSHSETEASQAMPDEHELAQRITRLQARNQRLLAD